MQKYFYPIFKLPDEYEKDFRKYTLPLWIKWWLLGKSARELSQILTGSSFMLTNTVKRRFKKFEVGGNTAQDGTPTLENEIPIQNVSGTIVNKVSNKNLLNINNPQYSWRNAFASNYAPKIENGSLYSGGQTGNTEGQYVVVPAKNIGSISISFTPKTNDTDCGAYIALINNIGLDNNMIITMKNLIKNQKNVFIINSNNYNYVGIAFFSNTRYGTEISDLQIEPGTTATPYVPHEEQIAQFTVAEGQRLMLGDTLEDDGIRHKRKQIVLDGTQPIYLSNWQPTESSVGWIYNYSLTNNKIITDASLEPNIVSDKLIKASYRDLYSGLKDNGIGFTINSNTLGLVIRIADTSLTSNATINAYLAENPILVEYELEEDEIVPYTATQQEQYNAILNLKTYKDMTIIETASDELSPILTLQYWKEKGTEDNLQLNYVNNEENPNRVEFIEDESLIPEDSINLDEIENDISFLDFVEEIGDNEESEENENESN